MASVSSNDDSKKIPLWYGNHKDAFTAEHWIRRLEKAQRTNGWSSEVTVGNAHSALREKGLQFLDYLEDEELNPEDWNSFKAAFLESFGTRTRDTSKITSLHLVQRSDEVVQEFGWRVNSTVQEFLTSVPDIPPPSIEFSEENIPEDMKATCKEAAHLRQWTAYIKQLLIQLSIAQNDRTNKKQASSLGRILFLNGLQPSIRLLCKLKPSESLSQAIKAAMAAEKAARGPTDKSGDKALNAITEEPSPDEEASINLMRRRSQYQHQAHRDTSSGRFRKRGSPECWYCHKKNHVQLNCRVRLARGASMVPKPRTVAEIDHDRMAYQDSSPADTEEEDEVDNNNIQVSAIEGRYPLNY